MSHIQVKYNNYLCCDMQPFSKQEHLPHPWKEKRKKKKKTFKKKSMSQMQENVIENNLLVNQHVIVNGGN